MDRHKGVSEFSVVLCIISLSEMLYVIKHRGQADFRVGTSHRFIAWEDMAGSQYSWIWLKA